MRKVIHPLDQRNGVSVFCRIEFDGSRLSISGVEGPMRNGDCRGSCGQIIMSGLRGGDGYALVSGWTEAMLDQFEQVWKRWHLNDMRAECEHQRALGWTWGTHPSEPCPTCGYKLGHEWKREEVPADVISFLESLPNTDRTPAWV